MPGGRYRNHETALPSFDESTQPFPVEKIRNCEDVAKEAMSRKMWVYDPTNKGWFTPEEFSSKFGRLSQGYEVFVQRVQIRDPRDGLNAGFRRLLDMQIKLEEFAKKMTDYYKGK